MVILCREGTMRFPPWASEATVEEAIANLHHNGKAEGHYSEDEMFGEDKHFLDQAGSRGVEGSYSDDTLLAMDVDTEMGQSLHVVRGEWSCDA